MNKRELVMNLVNATDPPDSVPAAFFLHFNSAYQQGQAAIDKHREFFAATDMDFVKIQYEQTPPAAPQIRRAEDWKTAPLCAPEFFEPTFRVVEGLVEQAHDQALVVLTLYSPFMWAKQLVGAERLTAHLKENPGAVAKGMAIMTENVLTLARGAKRAGVDGFYASTQGGEAFRFAGTDIFEKYIKPTDLRVWEELQSCVFNILHVCDYEGGYDDLTPFLDYPGHVVNSSLKVGAKMLSAKQMADFFGRPFMGGMDRHDVIATGNAAQIRQAVQGVLADIPARFILGADCTVPGETPWENLRVAVETAHSYNR